MVFDPEEDALVAHIRAELEAYRARVEPLFKRLADIRNRRMEPMLVTMEQLRFFGQGIRYNEAGLKALQDLICNDGPEEFLNMLQLEKKDG